MTAIPGTGTSTPATPQVPIQSTTPQPTQQPAIVFPSNSPQSTNTQSWYNKLLWWMVFGATIGVLLAFAGLLYPFFFGLAPLGPFIAALLWYVIKGK